MGPSRVDSINSTGVFRWVIFYSGEEMNPITRSYEKHPQQMVPNDVEFPWFQPWFLRECLILRGGD